MRERVLLDTSVWIAHYRMLDPRIETLLHNECVVMHPLVIGEIAVGNPRDRAETIRFLQRMPTLAEASHEDTLRFIENHAAYGRGIGYNDLQMLASVAMSPDVRLLSHDRRLLELAAAIGRNFTLLTQ